MQPFPLDAEHTDIVKFGRPQDEAYDIISKHLCAMVKATLPKSLLEVQPPSLINFSKIRSDTMKEIEASRDNKTDADGADETESSINQLSRDIRSRLSEETLQTLTESLNKFHVVFILDDSASMGKAVEGGHSKTPWDHLVAAMECYGDIAAQSSDSGIDLNFLVDSEKSTRNVRSREELLGILASIDIEHSSGAPLRKVLWKVLSGYFDNYRQWTYSKRLRAEQPKPLNLIIITDGCSEDSDEVEMTVVQAARELPRLRIPEFYVGIEFLQVGNDDAATHRLKFLDDRLADVHAVRDVSTHLHAIEAFRIMTGHRSAITE
jgi:hypothetical protein